MTPYQYKRLSFWTLAAIALSSVHYLLRHWLACLVLCLMLSPVTPHIRMQAMNDDRSCAYLGVAGRVSDSDSCRVIVWRTNTPLYLWVMSRSGD